MESRGMSELPPEAAVRNRALSPAPVTLRSGPNRPTAAQTAALSGRSLCGDVPVQAARPGPQTAPVSALRIEFQEDFATRSLQ
jgi:hypothetical protein